MAHEKTRRKFISLGEVIALAALAVSAAGLWLAWTGSNQDKPTRIVEQKQSIALRLRGKAIDDGEAIEINPVESSHSVQSLRLTTADGKSASVGSDGVLSAGDVEGLVGKPQGDSKGRQQLRARVESAYVEAGADKTATGNYVISYRWEGGGLFSGRSLKLVSFSRD